MAQNDNASKMKWQKDLDTFFPLYNTFLIDGYVDDEQPYVGDDGKKQYGSIEKYLEQTFGKDRCVVIYDPTEAEDMRFKICDEYVTVNEEEDQPADESADDMPPKVTREYDSDIAQHFWDIVTNENIGEQLIDHRRSGPTLDISRMSRVVEIIRRTWFDIIIKIIVNPLLMWGALILFPVDSELLKVTVMLSSMPCAVNCFIIAKSMGMDGEYAADLVAATTLLGILSIPAWAYALGIV